MFSSLHHALSPKAIAGTAGLRDSLQPINSSEAYFGVLAAAMRDVFFPCVDRIAMELLRMYQAGRSAYIFGNGGSAATASHFACDLGKGTSKWLPEGAKRFRVVALTDNIPVMTAWANDKAYDEIFAEQLHNLVRPDDVVLAISGSGNSPNVLKALQRALNSGAYTIGLTGFGGGRMKPLCRTCLIVPSENMEVIEDVHMAACHAIATVIRHALGDANGTRPKQANKPVERSVQAHPAMSLGSRDLSGLELNANSSQVPGDLDFAHRQRPTAGD